MPPPSRRELGYSSRMPDDAASGVPAIYFGLHRLTDCQWCILRQACAILVRAHWLAIRPPSPFGPRRTSSSLTCSAERSLRWGFPVAHVPPATRATTFRPSLPTIVRESKIVVTWRLERDPSSTRADVSAASFVPSSDFKEPASRARYHLRALMVEGNFLVVAVAVSHHGDLVWSEALGYADVESRRV